jgi:hypothetical protein
MDKHDFSEFYEIGGPLIEAYIKEDLKFIDRSFVEDHVINIKSCASYLLSLNDDEFNAVYIKMPRNIEAYRVDQADAEVNKRPYDYYTYAYAYVSHVELIRKCLAISKIPLFNSIQILTEYLYKGYIDISVESCKLLRENRCGYVGLLVIAHKFHNYDAIKYIIDSMTECELYSYLYSEYIYYGLYNILIIDKIYSTHDKYLISLLNSPEIDRNNNGRIIIRCYNIIKYLTLPEGKALMVNVNKHFESYLHKYQDNDTRSNTARNNIKTEQSLHNELLIKHFTSRGFHTKAATTF